jgi:hypothetical protein
MKLYLAVLAVLLALSTAHTCQGIGSSHIAKVDFCKVTAPAPQLKWTLNITLLQDYSWRGSDEVKYVYKTSGDKEIDETCYQGQTMKGDYKKGASLQVEQLCFGFKPELRKGDKLYVLIFWDRPSSEQLAIHFSFDAPGVFKVAQVAPEEVAKQLNLVAE